MEKEIKIWYDKEGDYPKIIFEEKTGHFRTPLPDNLVGIDAGGQYE